MHRSALRFATLVIATVAFLSCCTQAFALWAAPVADCSITLPYAASYQGRTHHGVDLAAPACAEVRTPVDGTVVFAGQVPADGGGSCWAVTLETGEGLRISLLPLDSTRVSAGGSVTAGEPVGALAAAGDDSGSEAHLHLSLRKGEAYLDPTAFLPTAPVQAPQPMPVPEPPAPVQPPVSGGLAAASAAPATPQPQAAAAAAAVAPAAASMPAVVEAPAAPVVATPRQTAETRPIEPETDVTGLGQTPKFGISLPPVKTTLSASLLLAMALTGVAIAYQRRVACHAS